MLAILALCAGAAVLPFVRPPRINTSLASLTVQNQPINAAVTSSALITTGASEFWALGGASAPPPPRAEDSAVSPVTLAPADVVAEAPVAWAPEEVQPAASDALEDGSLAADVPEVGLLAADAPAPLQTRAAAPAPAVAPAATPKAAPAPAPAAPAPAQPTLPEVRPPAAAIPPARAPAAAAPGPATLASLAVPAIPSVPVPAASSPPGGITLVSRRLQQAGGAEEPLRRHVQHTLHAVFHHADKSTMLTPVAIARIKAIEDEVFRLPGYQRLCLHVSAEGPRKCRRPVSATNFMYGTVTPSGGYVPDGNSDVQQDPVKAAQVRLFCTCRHAFIVSATLYSART